VARDRKRAKERRKRTPQTAAVSGARREDRREDATEAPDPLEHATPDVELAEIQLAAGQPDPDEPAPTEAELEAEEEETEGPASVVRHEERPHAGARLVGFAQGSWRELQRVQWPDRRQVVQATSVVIGFVIVAGAFLGVADFLAGHLMNYILTGHFK
jgi:preprotein translocase SecE subunit